MTVQAELTKEYIIELQIAEIDKLRAEVQRLIDWIMGDADAHTTLQSVYLDPTTSQGNRIKAAAASLPFEKPKLLLIVPSSGPDRKERWRAYERFRLKAEIIKQTKQLPAPGWDAKLVDNTYQPPEGNAEPPMDLYGKDAIKAHVMISGLMPKPGRNGNGSEGQD
jgi:hypothetical protein